MAEEELARTASPMPGAVVVLTVDGPPWCDEYEGIMLREVNAVMQGETSSMGNVIFPESVAAAMQSEA